MPPGAEKHSKWQRPPDCARGAEANSALRFASPRGKLKGFAEITEPLKPTIRNFSFAVFGAATLFLSACGGRQEYGLQTPAPTGRVDNVSYWDGYGMVGKPSIVIRLDEQVADFYIGGRLAGRSLVATGKEGFNTPAGEYTILEKTADKYSTLYGRILDAQGNVVYPDADIRRDPVPPGGRFDPAPMPHWMRMTWGGIGMHAGFIPAPGQPASHGCIRLPHQMAEVFFNHIQKGSRVTVIR